MKVHYAGNFGVSYSTESHLALALRSLGHEVVEHQEQHVDWWNLAETAEQAGADFFLHTHTHGFADESTHDAQWHNLAELRRRGIPSVGAHLDRWWGLERQAQAETEPFFRTDICATADGGHDDDWARVGVNHVWMLPAVNHEEVYRATPRPGRFKAVGFVGSWQQYGHAGVWPWRFDVVSAVWRRYGSRFRALPRTGAVRGADLNQAYAEMGVVLGDSCLAGGAKSYVSDRVPETIGRGGFLLHPRVEGVTDGSHYIEDEHLVCYDVGDLAEVFDQIDFWADPARDDQRYGIVEAGMRHVAEHHTYRHRMAAIVDMIEEYR